jgi:hypothetical protein
LHRRGAITSHFDIDITGMQVACDIVKEFQR